MCVSKMPLHGGTRQGGCAGWQGLLQPGVRSMNARIRRVSVCMIDVRISHDKLAKIGGWGLLHNCLWLAYAIERRGRHDDSAGHHVLHRVADRGELAAAVGHHAH